MTGDFNKFFGTCYWALEQNMIPLHINKYSGWHEEGGNEAMANFICKLISSGPKITSPK